MDPAADGDAKRRAQTALRDALGRMDQALNARDEDHLFASSVEAAMWATALDLYLHKSDDSYRTRRDADTGGRVVRGLAWARNAVIHDLLNVHVIQGGFTFPLAFPAIETWGAWWRRRDQVVVTFLDS